MLRAVIREVVNKDRRVELSLGLWLEVPAYVNARRYVDAAIIARAAENLQENDDEFHPFLIEMMANAYDEWAGENEMTTRRFSAKSVWIQSRLQGCATRKSELS